MLFKTFKQNGKDILINISNVISVKYDDASGKMVIYSIGQSDQVDESFDELKKIFGAGPKKEIRGF
jgi:hypothetical protein